MTMDDKVQGVREDLLTAAEPSVWPLVATGSACDTNGHCVTCSDEAVPAKVLHVDQGTGLAIVDVNGAAAEVDITLVDMVRVGQLLLVHGGIALASLE